MSEDMNQRIRRRLAEGHAAAVPRPKRRPPFREDPRLERLIELEAAQPGTLTPAQRLSLGHYRQAKAASEEQGA